MIIHPICQELHEHTCSYLHVQTHAAQWHVITVGLSGASFNVGVPCRIFALQSCDTFPDIPNHLWCCSTDGCATIPAEVISSLGLNGVGALDPLSCFSAAGASVGGLTGNAATSDARGHSVAVPVAASLAAAFVLVVICALVPLARHWRRHRRVRSKADAPAAAQLGRGHAAAEATPQNMSTGPSRSAAHSVTAESEARQTLDLTSDGPSPEPPSTITRVRFDNLDISRRLDFKSTATGSTATGSTFGATQEPQTLAEPDEQRRLLCALDNMSCSDPPPLFARRYVMLRDRAGGGQSVVNFARGADGGFTQFAIKCVSQRIQRAKVCDRSASARVRVSDL